MSENNKPLIFIEPLSETLKKLKEALEENADSEGIEIFDVGSVDEAGQLIPTVGQAVILTSSPKTCAVILQSNKKYIKKLQTKTLLLSSKAIPRKTLDKFMKVGLTECITEPVNPKTLLYKVRLHLRSITVSDDSKESDEQKKSSHIDAANNASQEEQSLRAEKGVILDDEQEEQKAPKDYKEENLQSHTKSKKNKSSGEDSIDGFYRGKDTEQTNSQEGEETKDKKKSAYQEESIDAHYKGNIEQVPNDQEKEDASSKDKNLPLDIAEDIEALKHQVNLEVQEDLHNQKNKDINSSPQEDFHKKSASLNIEPEKENSKKSQSSEENQSHYKGNINNNGLNIENDEDALSQEHHSDKYENLSSQTTSAQLQVDKEKHLDKNDIPQEENPSSQKKSLYNEQDSQSREYSHHKQLDVEQEHNNPNGQEELKEQEQAKASSPTIDITDDNDDLRNKEKSQEIDGYLRGGKAKKKRPITDNEENFYQKDNKPSSQRDDHNKSIALDIDKTNELKEINEENLEENNKKDQQTSLHVDDDEDQNNKKNKAQDQDSFQRNKSSYREEDSSANERSHRAHTQHNKDRHNKSNSKADNIKTHYDSRKGIKHGDKDWDSNWEKSGFNKQDFDTKAAENSISYEKNDFGEQTIDYSQIKKEFEGIEYDISMNQRKSYGEFDQVAQVKTYTKTILDPNGSIDTIEYEEIKNTQENESFHQVFIPDSKGIENVIEVLNFISNKSVDNKALYHFIATKIHELYQCDLALYFTDDKANLNLSHLSQIIFELGEKKELPIKDDNMNKKEFKQIIKEYEDESNQYKKNALTIESAWREKWESRYSNWISYKTPSWRDTTFQEEENEFIFPFYEGESLLGMVVATPKQRFIESKADSLEVTLESLRAAMLNEFHTITQKVTPVHESTSQKKESNNIFKKWFGKKAG